MQVSRDDILRYRVRTQQLDGSASRTDAAVLDLGVQDSGPDGAGLAFELRGAHPPAGELLFAWSLRGAPHAYRRSEAAQVAAAVAPWSEADAAKRIFDASRPLRAAGIPVLEALDVIAAQMRDIVTTPTPKGDLSRELSARLDAPYLRFCRVCDATHTYEQPFRVSLLRAGLELEPGTSPPVLRRIPGWRGAAARVPDHLDPVRAVLHLLGPATPRQVAAYVDSPVRDVAARWPEDIAAVEVDGEERSMLAADVEALTGADDVEGVRMLGPFDLFLQGRDRETVVPDEAARKDLGRTLGRPGGLLDGHEVVGTWRPRSSGRKLRLQGVVWSGAERPAGTDEAAARLATFRGQAFDGYVES